MPASPSPAGGAGAPGRSGSRPATPLSPTAPRPLASSPHRPGTQRRGRRCSPIARRLLARAPHGVQAAAAAGWRSAGIRRQRLLLPRRPVPPAPALRWAGRGRGRAESRPRRPSAASCSPAPRGGECRSLAAAAASQLPPGGLHPRLGRGRGQQSPRPPHPWLLRRAFRAAPGAEESSARLLRRLLAAGAPARPAAAPGFGSGSPCCPAGPGRATARAPPVAPRGRAGAAEGGRRRREEVGNPRGRWPGRAASRRCGRDVTLPGRLPARHPPAALFPQSPLHGAHRRRRRPPSRRRPWAPRGSQCCPPGTPCPGPGTEQPGSQRGSGSASRCGERPAGERHPGLLRGNGVSGGEESCGAPARVQGWK